MLLEQGSKDRPKQTSPTIILTKSSATHQRHKNLADEKSKGQEHFLGSLRRRNCIEEKGRPPSRSQTEMNFAGLAIPNTPENGPGTSEKTGYRRTEGRSATVKYKKKQSFEEVHGRDDEERQKGRPAASCGVESRRTPDVEKKESVREPTWINREDTLPCKRTMGGGGRVPQNKKNR